MGIFGDLKAAKDVQKLKNGGTAELSISQITGLLINLIDANKKLSKEKYNEIFKLYSELRTCKTKMKMDLNGYYETAVDIIKKFDKIAPYEKYSGGNEVEFKFLMDEIRNDESSSSNSKVKKYSDIEKAEICILLFNKSTRFINAFTELLDDSAIFQKYCNLDPEDDLYNMAHIWFYCICYSIMTYNLRNDINNKDLGLIRDSLIYITLGKDWVDFNNDLSSKYELDIKKKKNIDIEKISGAFEYDIITEKYMKEIKDSEKDAFTDLYNDLFVLFTIVNNEEYDMSLIQPDIEKTESIVRYLTIFEDLK